MTDLPCVVIVGAGFGGLNAAKALAGAPVRLVVLDRDNYHLFQPLLYQVATAALSPGDIASPIRWILRDEKNAQVLMAEAAGLDVERRIVRLTDGEVAYDYLILAAGATHAYFGHDEWEAWAPGLKTLDDALGIRRRVLLAFERAEREPDPLKQRELLTFVIVGGGPTGVELAGALAEITRHALRQDFRAIAPESARIILIEAGPRVLPAYPAPLSAFARRALERLGVAVWTDSPVTDVQPDTVRVKDETIRTGTILWAAGVAASPIARSLGVPLDSHGRVLVNPDLTIPGHPEVFVVGDLAFLKDKYGRPLPGVAQVAIQEAEHAARNVLHLVRREPVQPFVYRDYGNLATIGRNYAVADLGWLQLRGFMAWLAWLFVHVFKLIGFRNRLSVMTQWAFSYLTYQRAVRLITQMPRSRQP